MSIFLDFVAPTVKAFFLFMTFDFVKVTIKSRFCVGSTINVVHYVDFFANYTSILTICFIGNQIVGTF